jgi:hypothetical protein
MTCPSSHAARPAVFVALCLGLLAGSVTAQAGTISAAQWAKRADGICAYYNARYPVSPGNLSWRAFRAFWAKHGTAEIKLDNRFQKQIKAVPLPRNRKTLVQAWLRLNAQQTAWDKRFIAAAWRHDLSAFRAAYNHIVDRFKARKPVSRALGLKVCTAG